MDRTSSPPYLWLLCLMYVTFVLNHTIHAALNYETPLKCTTGSTPDISPLLRFRWKEPVYYHENDSAFPSESCEKRGIFVGIAENVGHAMTYKILTDDTRCVICRSNVRSALDSAARNLRMDPISGEDAPSFVKTVSDSVGENTDARPPAVFDPHDLVGRTFLLDKNEQGEQHRARIVELIEDHESKVEDNPTRIKFVCSVNDDQYEETLTYKEMLDYIEKDQEETDQRLWKFQLITTHEGLLTPDHPNYNKSKWNVMVEWENGEITTEPLAIIAADDPVTCTLYA